MTSTHVRVRNKDSALEAYCLICEETATIVMPMNAEDFCSMLTAFMDNHDDCYQED
jgi:hypothetical protein